MKAIFYIGLFLFAKSAFAQAETTMVVPAKNHPFYVGFRGASILGYRSLIDTDNAEWNQVIIGLRNDMEKPKFSYNGDLFAGFAFHPRWSVEFGVGFSNRGYQTKDLNFTSIDYPEGGVTTGRSITNDYYLDFPVRVNALFGKKNVKLLTSAGVITAMFITETDRFIMKGGGYDEDVTTESSYIDDFKKVNLFASGSVGIDWRILPMWHVRSEAFFHYGLLKISDTPVSARLYNGGISVGIIRQI